MECTFARINRFFKNEKKKQNFRTCIMSSESYRILFLAKIKKKIIYFV